MINNEYERMEDRKELVNKFVERVKKDYDEEYDKFIQSRLSYVTNAINTMTAEEIDYAEYSLMVHSALLRWIKETIIDADGGIFKDYKRGGTYPEFYVLREIIEMMLDSDINIVRRIRINILDNKHFSDGTKKVGWSSNSVFNINDLLCIHYGTINMEFVDIFEAIKWKEKHGVI